MKREIKFRAWDANRNQMISDEIAVGEGFIGIQYEDDPKYFQSWHDKDLIAMQFTGLKDKNGKEIYEGDIILVPDFYPQIPKAYNGEYIETYDDMEGQVFHEDGCFMVDDNIPLFALDESKYEIIGNIYENPELIN